MAKQTKQPKVRIARPANRPFQLRYCCPLEGREVRIAIGCRDENVAETEKAKLEAELLLGIRRDKKAQVVIGPQMPWESFRERYRQAELNHQRDRSIECAESRLDIAERILKPRTLADVARSDALTDLQTKLLAGSESRNRRPRSPITVKSYLAVVFAALNWAQLQGLLESVPRIKKVKTSKRKQEYASSHDLRRSCAQRLEDAGVSPMVIARVMRHASWETTKRHYALGDVQKDAGLLRKLLETKTVPGYTQEAHTS